MARQRWHDWTGERFGRLVVLWMIPNERRFGSVVWQCRCDCGRSASVASTNLVRGTTKSCGCIVAEVNKQRSGTHGKKKTPEYSTWARMKDRCNNPKNDKFKHYGGRGIKVCERWMESFADFLADMGPRPSKDHSIDRRDVNGNYCPENCEWATREQQMRSRRTTQHFTVDGVTKTLAEWSRETGIKSRTITGRIAYGWTVADAIKTKTNSRTKKVRFNLEGVGTWSTRFLKTT